jgi:serine O-acetyltransferase
MLSAEKRLNLLYKLTDHSRDSGFRNKVLVNLMMILHSSTISPTARMLGFCSFPHAYGITIGRGCEVGRECTIYHHVTLGQIRGKYPVIGSGVTIYPHSIILGETIIEDGAVVPPGTMIKNGLIK